MELVGFRGVSMRQGGISDALHTSPSRLDHRPSLEHTSSECLSQHTALRWMETAAGPEDRADTTPDPLEPVQCGVTKECRNCGLGSCSLINVVKLRKVCMFFRPYAEEMCPRCHCQPLFKTYLCKLKSETLALFIICKAEYMIQKLNKEKE